MAMVECKECGKPISHKASVCPHCGRGYRRTSTFTWIMAAVIAVMFIGWLVSPSQAPHVQSATAAASPSEAPRSAVSELTEAQRSSLASGIGYLFEHARNPASFDLTNARIMKRSNNVCFTYRAQNGYGGLEIEQASYSPKVNLMNVPGESSFREDFNRQCSDRLSIDVTEAAQEILGLLQRR